jgi:hypothetical protein
MHCRNPGTPSLRDAAIVCHTRQFATHGSPMQKQRVPGVRPCSRTDDLPPRTPRPRTNSGHRSLKALAGMCKEQPGTDRDRVSGRALEASAYAGCGGRRRRACVRPSRLLPGGSLRPSQCQRTQPPESRLRDASRRTRQPTSSHNRPPRSSEARNVPVQRPPPPPLAAPAR